MKSACSICGKMHKSKSESPICCKCKASGFTSDSQPSIKFGDGDPVPLKSFMLSVDEQTSKGAFSHSSDVFTSTIKAYCRRRIACGMPPLDRLFILESQKDSIDGRIVRPNCSKDQLLYKGIPVSLYYRESDMLAAFFVECMKQERRVGYMLGDKLIRSDT